LLEALRTLREAFAKTALAATIFALMAAFFSGVVAAANFFLRAKTLFAALSCAFNAAFFSGFFVLIRASFAAAI
jgi:hypothetical protein